MTLLPKDGVCLHGRDGSSFGKKEQHGLQHPRPDLRPTGIIIGVDEVTAKRATKDNLKQLGCLFLPQSGWRNETGMMDRTWLCAVRSGNS